MVAKGIVGVDAQGNPNWIRLSQIVVSGTGIDETVQSIQNDQVIQEGRISITETKVGMTVKSNDARPTKVYATYADLPAEGSASYKYYVEASGKYYKWENSAYVEFNPNGIAAGEICVAINNSGESEAVIDASKIYLLGQVIANTITADYIDSKIATLATLHGVGASFSGNMSVSGAVYGSGIYVGTQAPYVDISNPVNSVTITGPSSGVYTLTVTKADGTSSTYTFSHAATPTLSGSWSSGTLTVTSNPAAASNFVRTLSAGTATWSGNIATVPVNALYGSQQQYSESTGWNVYVNASSIYTNGYSDGVAATTVSMSGSWATNRRYDYTLYKNSSAASTGSIYGPWFFYTSSPATNNWMLNRANGPYLKIALSQDDSPWNNETWEIPSTSGGSYSFSAANNAQINYTDSVSGYLSFGSFSRAQLSSRTYIRFRVKCDDHYRWCYITVND
jgi:hypothetical protein